MAYSEGTYDMKVSIREGCEIEFNIPDTAKNWVHIDPIKGGAGTYALIIDDGKYGDTTVEVFVNKEHCTSRDIAITSPTCNCNEDLKVSQDTATTWDAKTAPFQIGTYSITPSCSQKLTVTAVTKSEDAAWLTITSSNNSPIMGTVTENPSTTASRDAIITVKGVLNGQSCNKTIKLTQGVNTSCGCQRLEITNVISQIPTTGLSVNDIIANYLIKNNCPETDYTPTLIDDSNVSYTVLLSNNNIILMDNIDGLEIDDDPRTFTLKITHNKEANPCYITGITQYAEECECKNAGSMVKMFKRTFSNNGTVTPYGVLEEMLIGSGQTSCGGLIAKCCSEMLSGGDLTWCENSSGKYGNIRTQLLDDGKFYFYAKVLRNDLGVSRAAGVVFVLVDKNGTPLWDEDCDIGYVIDQSEEPCDCSQDQSLFVIGGEDDLWSVVERVIGEEDKYWVKYNDNDNTIIVRLTDIFYDCKWYYIDYDEEYFSAVKGTTLNKNHWWKPRNGRDKNFYLKIIKPIEEGEGNEIEKTITVTEYVDAKVTDQKLDYGYPCTPQKINTVLYNYCNCNIENMAELNYAAAREDYYITLDSAGGTIDIYMYLFCAEDGRMGLVFPNGVTPWATIVRSEEDSKIWTINYEAWEEGAENDRTFEINIIPKINGVDCSARNLSHATQPKPEKICRNCEDVINNIQLERSEFSTSCNNYTIDYIRPFLYYGSCPGVLKYEVISSSTESPLENIWVNTDSFGDRLEAKNNRGDSDWKYTIRVKFSTVQDNTCFKEKEITIKPCYETCDCEDRHTEFSFNQLIENGTCFKSQAEPYEIVLGTVGDIDERDKCLTYVATKTEGEIKVYINNDKEVIAIIYPVQSTSHVAVEVSLAVDYGEGATPRYKECDKTQTPINFRIQINCD